MSLSLQPPRAVGHSLLRPARHRRAARQRRRNVFNRHDDGKDWNVDTGEGLRFDQKLWRPHETLSLGLQRSADHERESNAYRNTFALPPAAPTFDDLHLSHDLVKTEFSADYDLPLADRRELKLGYDLEERPQRLRPARRRLSTPSPAGSPTTPTSPTTSATARRCNAAYGQYETPLGGWDLQAGVRFEAARATTLQITGNIPGGRSDSGVYPSLHLTAPSATTASCRWASAAGSPGPTRRSSTPSSTARTPTTCGPAIPTSRRRTPGPTRPATRARPAP